MMTLAEFLEKKRLTRHAKIRRLMASDPKMSKVKLAERLGVSRQWLYIELSRMKQGDGK